MNTDLILAVADRTISHMSPRVGELRDFELFAYQQACNVQTVVLRTFAKEWEKEASEHPRDPS